MSEKKGFFSSLFGGEKTGGCCSIELVEETENSGCGCEPVEEVQETVDENLMTIKVLGSGCKSCVEMEKNVWFALWELKMEANVVKVSDVTEIAAYGVMATPALVIDEQLIKSGRVMKVGELKELFQKHNK